MSDVEVSMLSNPAVLGGLFLLLIIEFGLMIWALVDWIRRPAEGVRGNRVLWLLLLLFVNIVGPVLYLTLARLPKPADDGAVPLSGDSAGSALDSLYGDSRTGER